jgi:hypothetical protein
MWTSSPREASTLNVPLNNKCQLWVLCAASCCHTRPSGWRLWCISLQRAQSQWGPCWAGLSSLSRRPFSGKKEMMEVSFSQAQVSCLQSPESPLCHFCSSCALLALPGYFSLQPIAGSHYCCYPQVPKWARTDLYCNGPRRSPGETTKYRGSPSPTHLQRLCFIGSWEYAFKTFSRDPWSQEWEPFRLSFSFYRL